MNPTNPTNHCPDPISAFPGVAGPAYLCPERLNELVTSIEIPAEVSGRILALTDEALHLAVSHIDVDTLLEILARLPCLYREFALATMAHVVDEPEQYPRLAGFLREKVPQLDALIEPIRPLLARKGDQS